MSLTVLLATSQRAPLLQRTLKSLAACVLPDTYRQTIVVENGSRDGAEAVVAAAPPKLNVRYLYFPQGNKSAALNFALSHVGDGELVVFADDDVRFEPHVLNAYSDAAAGQTDNARRFFGGPVGVDYESQPSPWLLQYLPASAKGWAWDGPSQHLDQPVFLGFNWAAFSSDLREAGGFDPRRGPGAISGSTGQETEMQHRLLKLGIGAFYVPGAMVWHYVPAERCSAEWVLHRLTRVGTSRGIDLVRTAQAGAISYRQSSLYRVKRAVRIFLAHAHPSCRGRFRSKAWLEYETGVIHGIAQSDVPGEVPILSGSRHE